MYDFNKLAKFVDVEAALDICGDGPKTEREKLLIFLVDRLDFIKEEYPEGVSLDYLVESTWMATPVEVLEALACAISCGLVDVRVSEGGEFRYLMRG